MVAEDYAGARKVEYCYTGADRSMGAVPITNDGRIRLGSVALGHQGGLVTIARHCCRCCCCGWFDTAEEGLHGGKNDSFEGEWRTPKGDMLSARVNRKSYRQGLSLWWK